MGRLHVVGSLKFQVSFAKEPYERDDILQKRPIILRSLLIVATPYVNTSNINTTRGGGLGSSTTFKKFHETYAPS